MSGQYTYFARRGLGVIKIGHSRRPDLRLKDLQRQNPTLRLLGAVPSVRQGEAYVHRLFHSARIVGEWFWPRPNLLSFIEEAIRRNKLPGFEPWWREQCA